MKVYKTPDELFAPSPFNKIKVLKWLEKYGDHMTDDAYLDFAKSKGITPGQVGKRGYYDEYTKNDDFLKSVYNSLDENDEWDEKPYGEIDADYERSYGPIYNDAQYNHYLNWLKR